MKVQDSKTKAGALVAQADYDRAIGRWLALDSGRKPAQHVECFECHKVWLDIPSGFVYDDPAAGWRQDVYGRFVQGYCKPCADALVATTPRYGSREREDYLIECERFEDGRPY